MTTDTHDIKTQHAPIGWLWYAGVAACGAVWLLLYRQLIPFSEWATALFPVARDSHTGEAIAFFLYALNLDCICDRCAAQLV